MKKRGFTLVELLISVAVVGIVAAVVIAGIKVAVDYYGRDISTYGHSREP